MRERAFSKQVLSLKLFQKCLSMWRISQGPSRLMFKGFKRTNAVFRASQTIWPWGPHPSGSVEDLLPFARTSIPWVIVWEVGYRGCNSPSTNPLVPTNRLWRSPSTSKCYLRCWGRALLPGSPPRWHRWPSVLPGALRSLTHHTSPLGELTVLYTGHCPVHTLASPRRPHGPADVYG